MCSKLSYFIYTLANGACFLAPIQPSFCKPTSCGMRIYIFLGQIFQSGHQFGTPSIFQQSSFWTYEHWKCQISTIHAKHVGFGGWKVSVLAYNARSKLSYWNNYSLAIGRHKHHLFRQSLFHLLNTPRMVSHFQLWKGNWIIWNGVGRLMDVGSVDIWLKRS